MVRLLRACLSGGLMSLVVAWSVSAGAPVRFSDSGTFEGTFAECQGFDILGAGSFEIDEADYTDRDGNLREIQRFSIEYTMSRSDTGEVVGTGWGRSVLLAPLDGFPDGTYVGVRALERFANGSWVVETGRIVFDTTGTPIFVAGPHPFETTGVDRCENVAA